MSCRKKTSGIFVLMLLIFTINISLNCTSEQTAQVEDIEPTVMVLIPGGEFLMGHDSDGDHNPVHKVYIDSFYIDEHEVTNVQYLKYCDETESALPEFWNMGEFHCGPDFPNHPVVGVSWLEAKKYAEWAGKRLPTEAEWEYAARGGMAGKNYPNGDELDSTLASYTIEGKAKGTAPVGSFPPNGFGLFDMAGNVVEWVGDYYDGDYYNTSPDMNPQGPEEGKFRVIRGGGWHTGPYCNRVFFRNAIRENWRDINIGFRCAKSAE